MDQLVISVIISSSSATIHVLHFDDHDYHDTNIHRIYSVVVSNKVMVSMQPWMHTDSLANFVMIKAFSVILKQVFLADKALQMVGSID